MKHLCLDQTKEKRIDQFGRFRKDISIETLRELLGVRRIIARAWMMKCVCVCVCLLAPRGCVRWSIQNKDLGVKLPQLSYS